MAALELDTILDRMEMLNLILHEPRLVHVDEDSAANALDALFDEKERREDERLCRGYVEAVPDALYHAYRFGKCEKLFSARCTLDYAFERFDVFCCVCGEISRHLTLFHPDKLIEFLAPSVTRFSYVEEDEDYIFINHASIACADCLSVFKRRLHRNVFFDDDATALEAYVCDRLGLLISTPEFERRARKNASRWAGLRFDPRRVADA